VLTTFRSTRRGPAALWRFATALALLAQCWIAVAAFGDARGLGASAHVEAAGTSVHYAHNDADCAACSTLALSALPLVASVPGGEHGHRHEVVAAALPRAPHLARVATLQTRAPPSRG
jgi:hypothetical protein